MAGVRRSWSKAIEPTLRGLGLWRVSGKSNSRECVGRSPLRARPPPLDCDRGNFGGQDSIRHPHSDMGTEGKDHQHDRTATSLK